MRKLLITDLDNTLYDWVTFFSASFRSMVAELTALLELPSLQGRFADLSRDELLKKVDPALHCFNSTRKRTLALYPGAAEALAELKRAGVKIVGHTEAILANSYW